MWEEIMKSMSTAERAKWEERRKRLGEDVGERRKEWLELRKEQRQEHEKHLRHHPHPHAHHHPHPTPAPTAEPTLADKDDVEDDQISTTTIERDKPPSTGTKHAAVKTPKHWYTYSAAPSAAQNVFSALAVTTIAIVAIALA